MENEIKTNEITFATLLRVLKKGMLLMIITAIVFGSAAALFVGFTVKPKYSATASFWVKNSTSNSEYVTSALTGASTSIADNCIELVSQDMPIRQAVREYDLVKELGFKSEDECVRALQKTVSASKKNSTSFMSYVTVQTSDPVATYKIISALQYTLPSVLQELLWINVGGTDENIEDGGIEGELNLGGTREDTLKLVGPVTSVNDVYEVKTSVITAFLAVAAVSAIAVYAILCIIAICDRSVRDETTIKNNFTEPVVASVPSILTGNQDAGVLKHSKKRYNVRNYEQRLLSSDSPMNVREAFNTLKTNLTFYTASETNPVIALTSAHSGEGKSLISANLAISMSSASNRVLLVECDMRNPAFARMLDIEEGTGLSELLSGTEPKTENVICRTRHGSFDVIPCGKIPPNPTELLSSKRMRELVAEWKEKYDFVILDVPPMCEFVDAAVVSPIISGYLVIARSGFSDTAELSDTLARLKTVNGNVIGFVVNDVSADNNRKLRTVAEAK